MTEIQQLKEEIAKLRERIAVLEAQPHNKWVPYPTPNVIPQFVPYTTPAGPWRMPYEITCGGNVC